MIDKVYAICYNTLYVFENKEKTKEYFKFCYNCSEGAEHERYASILADLNFSKIAKDNVSKECREINIISDNSKDNINIHLDNLLSIEDSINYYEKNINSILEVAENYGIDFNSSNPFDYFDADNGNYNMSSFTKFYNDIFKKLNINFDNMFTKEVSDGKYELILDDNILDLSAWDTLENVIDNVNCALDFYKNKDKGLEER